MLSLSTSDRNIELVLISQSRATADLILSTGITYKIERIVYTRIYKVRLLFKITNLFLYVLVLVLPCLTSQSVSSAAIVLI